MDISQVTGLLRETWWWGFTCGTVATLSLLSILALVAVYAF